LWEGYLKSNENTFNNENGRKKSEEKIGEDMKENEEKTECIIRGVGKGINI